MTRDWMGHTSVGVVAAMLGAALGLASCVEGGFTLMTVQDMAVADLANADADAAVPADDADGRTAPADADAGGGEDADTGIGDVGPDDSVAETESRIVPDLGPEPDYATEAEVAPECVPPGCDDGDGCTVDACDPALGCIHIKLSGWDQSNCKKDGVCALEDGYAACSNGKWTCVYAGIKDYEEPEKSCDGKDNDCDGYVDDGLAGVWSEDCLGIGVCAAGAPLVCEDEKTACDYSVLPGFEAEETKCDALDNDCDGQADEACDLDGDGIEDSSDNCPTLANRPQLDSDLDETGDACDTCPVDGDDETAAQLLAWFPFEEKDGAVAKDLSMNALVATVAGQVVVGNAGFRGRAVFFDGKGSLDVSVTPAGVSSLSQMSVEAYVQAPPSALGADRHILDNLGQTIRMIMTADGELLCSWNRQSGGPIWVQTTGFPLADGKWHHVACVRHVEPGALPKIAAFVDGFLAAALVDTNSGSKLAALWPLKIGSALLGGQWIGGIDELKVWLSARDPSADWDLDGFPDMLDDCPMEGTPQSDGNGDGVGDYCSSLAGALCLVPADCDDGNPCSADSCGQDGKCQSAPVDGPCDDGSQWTIKDTCSDDPWCVGELKSLNVTGETALEAGHYFYSTVEVKPGAKLKCKGDQAGFAGRGCFIHAVQVTIHQDGVLTADGEGFCQTAAGDPACVATGPGFDPVVSCECSGGNHAGPGGLNGAAASSYGNPDYPVSLGSSGNSPDNATASRGGGAIALLVWGKLTLDGAVSANGTSPPPGDACRGGGAGGSILISAGTFSGSGSISANGGSVLAQPGACPDGAGGGSGGRIAIYQGVADFSGTISVAGGTGYPAGANGTQKSVLGTAQGL